MLIITYWISSLILILLIVRQHTVDRTTIFGVGLLLYGLPLFFGYTVFQLSYGRHAEFYYEQIDDRIYIIFLMSHLIFYISYFWNVKIEYRQTSHKPNILMFYSG